MRYVMNAVPYKYSSPQRALRFIQSTAAGAAQWRLANHRLCLFLERCCMGVVHQIKDLDNSSKALPYKYFATYTVVENTLSLISQLS